MKYVGVWRLPLKPRLSTTMAAILGTYKRQNGMMEWNNFFTHHVLGSGHLIFMWSRKITLEAKFFQQAFRYISLGATI